MTKVVTAFAAAVAAIAVAGQALALNPQPLPPRQMPTVHGAAPVSSPHPGIRY